MLYIKNKFSRKILWQKSLMTCNININFTVNANYQILLSQEFFYKFSYATHSTTIFVSIVSHAGIASSLAYAPPMWMLELNQSQQTCVGKAKIKAPLMVLRSIFSQNLYLFLLTYKGTRSLPTLFSHATPHSGLT